MSSSSSSHGENYSDAVESLELEMDTPGVCQKSRRVVHCFKCCACLLVFEGSSVQAGIHEATKVLVICESTSRNSPEYAYQTNDQSIIRMVNREDEKVPEENICENPGRRLKELVLGLNEEDYMDKITKLQVYLDMVKEKVRPGCSQEVLNVALRSMSSVARILTAMSSTPKLHASL